MKVDTSNGYVNSNVELEKTAFRVDASAHFFQVISSQLYTRPINAIVRELSCNAFDSHVKNGNPEEPFVIKFPNSLDPEFYVQDFGTGMSPEQIRDVYTVVFASDKQNTNDLTGGFGLGSKSVFSYTDSATVNSVYNGRKYIYQVYKNEQGVPEAADISQGGFPTNERNGVKISFNVKPNDFYLFTNAGSELSFFTTRPKVIANSNIPYYNAEEFTKISTVDEVSLCWRSGHSTVGKFSVIMGNVRYPLNIDKLQLSDQFIVSLLNSIYCKDIYIFVPIGAVTPVASREELQYDAKTIDFIKAIFSFEEKKRDKSLADFKKIASDAWKLIEYSPNLISRHVSRTKITVPDSFLELEVRNTEFKDKIEKFCKEFTDDLCNILDVDSMLKFHELSCLAQSKYNKVYEFKLNSWSINKKISIRLLISKNTRGLSKSDYKVARDKYCSDNEEVILLPRTESIFEKCKDFKKKYGKLFNVEIVDLKENPFYKRQVSKKEAIEAQNVIIAPVSEILNMDTINPLVYRMQLLDDKLISSTPNLCILSYDQWRRINVDYPSRFFRNEIMQTKALLVKEKEYDEIKKKYNLTDLNEFIEIFNEAVKNEIFFELSKYENKIVLLEDVMAPIEEYKRLFKIFPFEDGISETSNNVQDIILVNKDEYAKLLNAKNSGIGFGKNIYMQDAKFILQLNNHIVSKLNYHPQGAMLAVYNNGTTNLDKNSIYTQYANYDRTYTEKMLLMEKKILNFLLDGLEENTTENNEGEN